MPKTDLTFVRHMLDAAHKVVQHTQDRSREDLDQDELLAFAIVHLIEILGEASRNVDVSTRSAASDIPWREIAATRNRLIHHYFDVDLDIVWEIAVHDLPNLIPRLERLAHHLQGQ